MAKQNSVMEIGVMTNTRTEGNPFDKVAEHGVHVTQMSNWNMELCTAEFGKKIKKMAKDSKVRLNSLWVGYSGNCVWNFTEGPTTLGIVPPELREQRVKDLLKGAELAAWCEVPAIATHSRVRWAGLDPNDFEYITTYENSYHCKPNPDYYREILDKLNLDPEECLMVGNDVSEDMVAESLGMKVFLLTDSLINRTGEDIARYPHGSFGELMTFIREL